MNESNHAEMKNFVDHNATSGWSETGKSLMNNLKTETKFYETVKSLKGSDGKGVVVDSFEGRVPSQQKFLDNVMKFYDAELVKDPQKQSLVFLLLQTMLQKLNGARNPHYGEKCSIFTCGTQ